MIEKRNLWLVGIAGFLAVNVVTAFHFYERGKMKVALKATEDSLVVVRKEGKAIRDERDAISRVLDEQSKKTAESRTVYVHDKSKVTLKGDTAVTKDSSQVLLPEVAQELRDAEAHIANLESENSILRADLLNADRYIKNLEQQVALNERVAKMVQGPKCQRTCGIVIGVASTIGAAYVASLLHK